MPSIVKFTLGFLKSILEFFETMLDLFLFVLSLKVFPLAWHARSYYSFISRSKLDNRPVPLITFNKPTIFQPTIWTSNTPLGEIDIMGHKTNSTYATDFDVARNYHMCSIFRIGLKLWGDVSFINPQTRDSQGTNTGLFYPALAGASFTFHKAIRPRQKYEIRTRVLSWDEKWLHLISHFVERGHSKNLIFSDHKRNRNSQLDLEMNVGIVENSEDSQDNGRSGPSPLIFATAMGKIVFKKGRKTIPPSQFLVDCGLLPQQENLSKSTTQESVNYPNLDGNEKGEEEKGDEEKGDENDMAKIGEMIECIRADGHRVSRHLNSLVKGYSFYNVSEKVFFSKC